MKICDFEDENSCLNTSIRSPKLFYIKALCTIFFVSNIFFFLICYYFKYVLMGSQILGFK